MWRWRQSRRGRWAGKGPIVAAMLLALTLLFVAGCSPSVRPDLPTPEQVAAEIIPEEGNPTSYGIPLSLSNTQRFIDYFYASTLTPEQADVKVKALRALKAPCCDDNTMDSC